jgi:quercetin 2,3-dioxygenase
MIGAWCFLDHFLPSVEAQGMRVAAHPHTGLQTVTWLFSGLVHHNDSLRSSQIVKPGQLNLMTAGRGISHSEASLKSDDDLHGIQLWVALPDEFRSIAPSFDHYQNLPQINFEGVKINLLVGQLLTELAPTQSYSPLFAAQLDFLHDAEIELPLNKNFEYGFLAIDTDLFVDDQKVAAGAMLYQPAGETKVLLRGKSASTLVVIGGEPFTEEIVMWWNFIGRNHEEVAKMRTEWQESSEKFGTVIDDLGERIPAPPMPNIKLQPRGPKRKSLG